MRRKTWSAEFVPQEGFLRVPKAKRKSGLLLGTRYDDLKRDECGTINILYRESVQRFKFRYTARASYILLSLQIGQTACPSSPGRHRVADAVIDVSLFSTLPPSEVPEGIKRQIHSLLTARPKTNMLLTRSLGSAPDGEREQPFVYCDEIDQHACPTL